MTTFTREQLATLREAAQNYQSMLAWYQEKPDSPNAEQDCDAALAAFKREIRHREVDIIAYLLDELEAAKSKLNEQREYYEGVIADGSKRIAELEKSEEQLINERDHAASRMQQPDGWEAVAVAWKVTFTQVDHESNTFTAIYFDKAEVEYWVRLHKACGFRVGITPLYAAPPVPDKLPRE